MSDSFFASFHFVGFSYQQVKKAREAGKGVVEEGARVEDVAGGFGSGGPEDSVGEEPKV